MILNIKSARVQTDRIIHSGNSFILQPGKMCYSILQNFQKTSAFSFGTKFKKQNKTKLF